MKNLHMITFLLLVVGGLNWLLQGVFGWDIGQLFGGQEALISRIIYILVGLSAIYELATHKSGCKTCSGSSNSTMPSSMPQ
jgi:uncharacterized membrane protein YuzA (DUF378 family)